MTYVEESQAAGRHIFPDLARAWALVGIGLVNVGVLAWPMMSSYNYPGGLTGSLDRAAFFGVNALFLMKSYSLFSFMFGVGFAYQMKSVERRQKELAFDNPDQKKIPNFASRYWRRILGLLAFGIVNIALFFIGDILIIYAILGSLLFLFRNASQKTLMTWGFVIYGIQILIAAFMAVSMYLGVTFAPEEMAEAFAEFAESDASNVAVFGSAGFVETVVYRIAEYIKGFPFIMMFQGFGALAFFLFGLAAVRSGTIADPSAPVWKRARRVALPIGLVISSIGAWLIVVSGGMTDPRMFGGIALITLGSPFSTAGYLGLIAKWAQGGVGPVKAFFARGGTASLTAYLMQGLFFSLIFSAYGLGLYAKLPAAACIGIAILVTLFTVAFTSLWRTQFKRGPMEVILRGFTYLGAR